jgi:hypothetical protein
MPVKVFLGGEGTNDIGTRAQATGNRPGVIEVLLKKLRPDGWKVVGAIEWKSIRKYRAGAATQRADHADVHNVHALVQRAYEDACEMLVFVRDVDGEQLRAKAIRKAVAELKVDEWAADYGYALAIAGGIAQPTLEAWILHLHGVPNTDELTKAGAERKLLDHGIALKSSANYLAIAEACDPLPTGAGSLCEWLDCARATFAQLIDGIT